MPTQDWEERFTRIDALWYHDGNPQRPYVRLTTDTPDGRARISNGYFNGSVVQEHAVLFGEACEALAAHITDYCPVNVGMRYVYAIAVEKGGTALSQRIAEAINFRSAYAEKQSDGTVAFERFSFQTNTLFQLTEDTITSGETVGKLIRAARLGSPKCQFLRVVLAFCNRSSKTHLELEGGWYEILALVDRPMQTWPEGENPFTGGAELVPPVKAKTHWHELTRSYA